MANRQINLVITGNNRGAIRAIDQVGVSASRAAKMSDQAFGQSTSKIGGLFKKLDSQLGQFGVPFAGALGAVGTKLEEAGTKTKTLESRLSTLGGAIALGAAAGLAVVGKSAVQAGIEGEQAHAQLVKAVQNTGHAYDQYADKVDGASRKLADYGFENDQVETSIATLTRVTKDAGHATGLMGLAADIARAKGMDLASATNILVAVEAGRYTVLRKQLGLTKDQVKGIKSESDAVRLLSSIYGGAAAASAETFGGKIAALQAKTKNLEEELGLKLLPVIEGTVSGLLGSVRGFESANQATDGWLGKLAMAGTILPVTVFAVTKLQAGVTALGAMFVKSGSATTAYGTAAAGAAAKTELVASAQAQAALSATEEMSADSALTAAKARLVVAQNAEAAAIAKLTAAQEAYIAASAEAAIAPESLAAANALGTASRNLGGAQRGLEATAKRTAIAEAEVGAASAATAGSVGLAARATAFFGQEMTIAGGAGVAAVAGLLSFQLTTWAINKVAGITRPNVEELGKSLATMGRSGAVAGEMARAFGSDLSKLANDFAYLDRSVGSKAAGAFITFGHAGRQAKADVGALDQSLAQMVQTAGPAQAQAVLGELSAKLAAQGVTVDDIVPRLHDYMRALEDAQANQSDAERATDQLAAAEQRYQRDLASGTATREQLARDEQSVASASRTNAIEQAKLADAQKKTADSSQMSADALKGLAEATGLSASQIAQSLHLTDAQAKILTDDIKALKDSFSSSFSSGASIIGDFKDKTNLTFADVRAEYQKNIAATDKWAMELGALAQRGLDEGLLKQLIDAGPKAINEVDAIFKGINSGSVEALNQLASHSAKVRELLEIELAKAATRASILSSIIGEKIRSGIPKSVSVDVPVTLSGTGGELIRQYLAAGGTYNALISGGIVAGPPSPGRAKGGPVQSNTPYMVGERGPELFVPNQSGTIIPNGALRTNAQGRPVGTDGGTINVQVAVNVDPITGRKVYRLVQSDQRTNGPWNIRLSPTAA